MKRSVKAIAAAAAAVTMALSCVPSAYAVGDSSSVQAEESSAKYGFTEGKTIVVPYDGSAMFVSDDGTVYYRSYDSNDRVKIFTLDENGRVRNYYNIDSYENDNGEKVSGGVDAELKQCGGYLYLIYSEYYGTGFFASKENNVIVKLDKELNEIAKYSYEKKASSIDTNGEKVVYLKGTSKIYICDMDGKNKKLLYSVNNSDNCEPYEQPLNSVAIAGNYVGFQKRTGYANESGQKAYCGIIDIETGEVTLHKQRSVEQVFSSNGNLIWYGEQGYYPDPEGTFNNVPSALLEGDSWIDYYEKRYKYYSDSEIYIFDGENYSVITSPDTKELGYGTFIDNEGNLITTSYDKKEDKMVYRVYHNGELMDELKVDYKYSGSIVANGGVMAFCFTGRTASADDWIGWNNNTPQEEVEAMLAAQAERAAKLKEMYPMKSVTFSYK